MGLVHILVSIPSLPLWFWPVSSLLLLPPSFAVLFCLLWFCSHFLSVFLSSVFCASGSSHMSAFSTGSSCALVVTVGAGCCCCCFLRWHCSSMTLFRVLRGSWSWVSFWSCWYFWCRCSSRVTRSHSGSRCGLAVVVCVGCSSLVFFAIFLFVCEGCSSPVVFAIFLFMFLLGLPGPLFGSVSPVLSCSCCCCC